MSQSRAEAKLHPWQLLAQLVVVFLGVFGAFLLDGCREERASLAKKELLLQSLSGDFAAGVEGLEEALERFDQSYKGSFLDPLERGERPPLVPIPLPPTVDSEGWDAMLGAGGLEVLDLDLIREVEITIYSSNGLGVMSSEFNAYVREILVPNLDAGEDEFYRAGSPELRQKYLWYYYGLDAYRRALQHLHDRYETLHLRTAGELSR